MADATTTPVSTPQAPARYRKGYSVRTLPGFAVVALFTMFVL